MDYEKLFPGRFIKAADLDNRQHTLTIKDVHGEEIDGKQKAILSFTDAKKALVMNRTNAEHLKLMFGRETSAWVGKRVTIYGQTIKDPFGDGEIKAIRVLGSPDITQAATATVQRGRKTISVKVQPTGKPAATPPQKAKNGAPSATTQAPMSVVPEPMSEEERLAILAQEAGSQL